MLRFLPTSAMDSSQSSYIDLLRRIHFTASKSTNDESLIQSSGMVNVDTPVLDLPPPEDITIPLINIGCPSLIARELSDAYSRSANEIHATYEAIHRNTMDKAKRHLVADPGMLRSFQRLLPVVECQYQEEIQSLKQLAFDRVHKLKQTPRFTSSSKPVFNQVWKRLSYFIWLSYRFTTSRNSCPCLKNILNTIPTLLRLIEPRWPGNLT